MNTQEENIRNQRGMKSDYPNSKAGYHHGNLKKALIDGASTIIGRDGRQGLTMRAVAAAASVSHTAPYRHFKNKEAILAAVAEEGFGVLARDLGAIAEKNDDFLERIICQGHAYAVFARENPAHFEVMFGFNLQEFFIYPSLLETASSAAMHLLESVEKCQKAGILQSGNPMEIAFGAWMLIHGLATLLINGLVPFDTTGEDALKNLVRQYALGYLEGMRKRD